jgi:hypothetical protein
MLGTSPFCELTNLNDKDIKGGEGLRYHIDIPPAEIVFIPDCHILLLLCY